MKTFPAVVVANYFIERGKKEGRPIEGILKLIKLVYLAHGWHLGLTDEPLIREKVEAWKYGPVVRSVYDAFKGYGKGIINERAITGISEEMEGIEKLADNETIDFLNDVWDLYRDFSGLQLSKLTHGKDTPWDITWRKEGKQSYFGDVIRDEIIREYYDRRIQEDKEDS